MSVRWTGTLRRKMIGGIDAELLLFGRKQNLYIAAEYPSILVAIFEMLTIP